MPKIKGNECVFRPELVPNLVESIWNAAPSYAGQIWDLPQDRSSLQRIVGAAETEYLYSISNSSEQNIYLRSLLATPLRSEHRQERLAAMVWVIYDWGNVRGRSEKHEAWPDELSKYSDHDVNAFISRKQGDRIASWSKVLAFADCMKYAIYDARVVMTLNAILDDFGYPQRFYMPPPSSKKLPKVFSEIKKQVSIFYGHKKVQYMGYFEYMNILHAIVEKNLASDVLTVEMSLFANSEKMANKYALKYGLPAPY